MAKEHSFGKMVIYIQENGMMTKCMAKEYIIIQMARNI